MVVTSHRQLGRKVKSAEENSHISQILTRVAVKGRLLF